MRPKDLEREATEGGGQERYMYSERVGGAGVNDRVGEREWRTERVLGNIPVYTSLSLQIVPLYMSDQLVTSGVPVIISV